MAITPEIIAEMKRLRFVDGLTYKDIGARVGVSIPTASYYISGKSKRPKRAKAKNSGSKKYTCSINDLVVCDGKLCIVQQVLDDGDEARMKKSYIKCCVAGPSGEQTRQDVFAGCDWRHARYAQ